MIDLRSDTVTKPTKGMLDAMFSAKVGDDVLGDDATVTELESKMAQYFGKEAALFFPSGTMANQAAIMGHVRPGDEVICDQTAHVYRYEGGGIAANAGASVRLLYGNRGVFTADEVLENLNEDDVHLAKTKLICIENTVNMGGGICWPIENVEAIGTLAKKWGLAMHLDGARLWNALVAKNMNPIAIANSFDTLSVCLSKGLGCPVGSVLLGKTEAIQEAKRIRKRLGGGMRQAGYLAAAGIYAMDNHIERLSQDHLHAAEIEKLLSQFPWVEDILPVETNILFFKVKDHEHAVELAYRWNKAGVKVHNKGQGWVRLVFHLDVGPEQMDNLMRVFKNT